MSYDLWAWRWADNEEAATPAEIVALPLATSEGVKSSIPGLTEFIVDGAPNPAMAPFDADAVMTTLRERLGRHAVLTGENPSLQAMELFRDREGNGWRFDFAVERELVEHLLPVGLGTAFAKEGLVLFDAWRQRLVRPGHPKNMVFEWGGRSQGAEYEPDWKAIAMRLAALAEGDYAILQNNRSDYVQCAGASRSMTIECRIWNDSSFHHWVAGSQDEDAEVREVIGPTGPVSVRAYEVLGVDDAMAIFKTFFQAGKRMSRYRWRDITSNFVER